MQHKIVSGGIYYFDTRMISDPTEVQIDNNISQFFEKNHLTKVVGEKTYFPIITKQPKLYTSSNSDSDTEGENEDSKEEEETKKKDV